jgi:hypothetical protein
MRYLILGALAAAACAGESYTVVLLKTSPTAPALSKEETTNLGKGHMAHIGAMAKSGDLVAAGPMVGSPKYRGVFIFKSPRAKELTLGDPAVKAGVFTFESHAWDGPAGIGEAYMKAWRANPDLKPNMIQLSFGIQRPGTAAPARARAGGKVTGSPDVAGIYIFETAPEESGLEIHKWMVADGVIP